jgi:hypothetical protein
MAATTTACSELKVSGGDSMVATRSLARSVLQLLQSAAVVFTFVEAAASTRYLIAFADCSSNSFYQQYDGHIRASYDVYFFLLAYIA